MPKTHEGNLIATGLKFGLVVSRFNDFITSKLLDGALDALKRHGAKDEEIEVAWVPGAFETPFAARAMAKSGKFDAVICLGCLIRGGTPHFDFIAAENAKGIGQVGMETGVPTIYGVITTDNIEQAIERAGTKAGNKGAAAAVSGIEMANLMRSMGVKGK